MKRLFIKLIRFYQRKISPKKGKKMCRFRPTCSQFAVEAIERYGAFLGLIMAVCRFLRCNPLFRGGYDPVPEHFTLLSGVGRYKEPSVCENCQYCNRCDKKTCSLLKGEEE